MLKSRGSREVYNVMNLSYSVSLQRSHQELSFFFFFLLLYITSFSDGDFKWKLNVKQTTFSFYCKFIQV